MPDPHLVYITHSAFWRPSNGQWARARALAEYLGARMRLTVVYLGALTTEDQQSLAANRAGLRVLATGRDPATRGAMTGRVRDLLAGQAPTACLIEGLGNAYLLDALPPRILRILDCQDLLSQRRASMARLGLEPDQGMDEAVERTIIDRFDLVLCIQREDLARISSWKGRVEPLLAPHPARCLPMAIRPGVGAIGMVASNYHPNVDGLNHFLQRVWPRLATPGLQLHLFGNISAGFQGIRLRNVRFHGIQPLLEACYQKLDIVINPVRYGSGLKIKSVEALGHGLPLVTTREGASGLTHLDGRALIIADSDGDFAAAIDLLAREEGRRRAMAAEGLAEVALHLNPEACFGELARRILGSRGTADEG